MSHEFVVELENFSGPFEVLLGLINKRKLDITDIALAAVTDEFIAHVVTLRQAAAEAGWSVAKTLDQLSSFLLIAATLLDLKTARLLPAGAVDDELDLELLEARDLLFARLLQYRAYKAVSGQLRERFDATGQSIGTPGNFSEEFHGVLPPLVMVATPEMLAAMYAAVISRDTTPPTVSVDHLHVPLVSVAEQRAFILGLIATTDRLTFDELVATADNTQVVIARFLALLELFKAGAVELDQEVPLGELVIAGRRSHAHTA